MQSRGLCRTGALGVWMMGTGCVPSEHAGHSPPPLPPTLNVHSSDHCQELSAGSGVMGGDSSEGRRVKQVEKGKTWIPRLPFHVHNVNIQFMFRCLSVARLYRL